MNHQTWVTGLRTLHFSAVVWLRMDIRRATAIFRLIDYVLQRENGVYSDRTHREDECDDAGNICLLLPVVGSAVGQKTAAMNQCRMA